MAKRDLVVRVRVEGDLAEEISARRVRAAVQRVSDLVRAALLAGDSDEWGLFHDAVEGYGATSWRWKRGEGDR